MTDPTYRLEGIVKTRDEMQDFEGPLTLILMLLSKNKIEIRDIQISAILDQYLDHLNKMQEIDLEIASEFVQMASHLLYIKTRMLLAGDEEVSELESLVTSLEQLKCREAYAGVKEITPELLRAYEQGSLLLIKPAEPLPQSAGSYRYNHTEAELLTALLSVFSRAGKTAVLDEDAQQFVPKRIVYGVRDKSHQLIEHMRAVGTESLRALFELSKSRSELVATFVALLELCSMGSLYINADSDDDCTVTFTGGETGDIIESISDL